MVLLLGGEWEPMHLFAAEGGTVCPHVWVPDSASIRADICMLYMSNAHCSTDDTVRGLVGGEVGAHLFAPVGGAMVAWWSGLMESE